MSETTIFAVVGVAFAVALAVIVYFIVMGVMDANALNAAVKTVCIENGGTWVDGYSLCIADGSVAK